MYFDGLKTWWTEALVGQKNLTLVEQIYYQDNEESNPSVKKYPSLYVIIKTIWALIRHADYPFVPSINSHFNLN